MKMTVRMFYLTLPPDKKKLMAKRLRVAYTTLCRYFPGDIERRPNLSKKRLREMQEALNEVGGNFKYTDVVEHFFIK